jgi:streptogramin lyase
MRQRWSISGEVLCLADIGATLDLAAAAVAAKLPGQSLFDSLSNAAIAGKASANFTVEVGIDPFSVEYDKTFSLYFSLSGNQSPPLQLDYDL